MASGSWQILEDKRALDDLIYTQTMAMDTRDWATYRRCLADEIDFDLRDHFERFAGKGAGLATDPDAMIEGARAILPGFDATMHSVTNLVHTVDGDSATSVCFTVGQHYLNNELGDRNLDTAMHSTYGCVRSAAGWKIRSLVLKVVYYKGNISLFDIAAKKVAAGQGD